MAFLLQCPQAVHTRNCHLNGSAFQPNNVPMQVRDRQGVSHGKVAGHWFSLVPYEARTENPKAMLGTVRGGS